MQKYKILFPVIIIGLLLIIIVLLIRLSRNTEINILQPHKDTTSATTKDSVIKENNEILKPEEVVKKFLTEVAKKDRSSVMKLVKNWTIVRDMFKNIDSIKIVSISVISETADIANIKAIYKTFLKKKPKAGSEIAREFILSKEADEWMITGIRIIVLVPPKDTNDTTPKKDKKDIKDIKNKNIN